MKKIILITGANKGIGFETARQLGVLGHTVIISARNAARMNDAVKKLKDEGTEADGLLMDVSNAESIAAAAKEFGKRAIKLDAIINNAAELQKRDKSILQDSELLLQTLTTNSVGPLRVCNAFLPFIRPQGRIINISSGGGSMTDPVGGWAPSYCVSKSLLNAITRQLAYELEDKNISVNAVCPGWVRTDMGGAGASRPVQKGAETPVWLATEAPHHLTGKFFRDKKEIPW